MTKIKLCGMRRICDMEAVNEFSPEYIGFVFAKKSKRYVTPDEAEELRKSLKSGIIPVGVFMNEKIEQIVELLERRIIDAVQLHGNEDEEYIDALRKRCNCEIIKAFRVKNAKDIEAANHSLADYILLDSGGGSGETFDWSVLRRIKRAYFLAGGLTSENVAQAVKSLSPFGVDASSGLETGEFKDKEKMAAFVNAVRQERIQNYG